MKATISFSAEADRIKAENERLREKHLHDIQLLVNQNLDDPIAALNLELEKMEQKYFQQKEQIRIKDNALQAMKDLNNRLYDENKQSPKPSSLKNISPKLVKKESSN